MQYRRERLMVPMVVVSSVAAILLLIVVHQVAVYGPGLEAEKKKNDREIVHLKEQQKENARKLRKFMEIIGNNAQDVTNVLNVPEGERMTGDAIRAWRSFLGSGSANATGVEYKSIAPWAGAIIAAKKTAEGDIKAAEEKAEADSENKKNDFNKIKGELNAKIIRLDNIINARDEEIITLKKRLEQIEALMNVEIDRLKAHLKSLNEEMEAERRKNYKISEERGNLKSRLEAANAEIEMLRRSMEGLDPESEKVDLKVDGEILSISSDTDSTIGAINLGSEDGLKKGVIFQVFRDETVKGRVQVYKINKRNSLFRLVELEADTDPIVAGDKIFSPLFNKGYRPEFVIVGHFKTADFAYGRDDIKVLIEKWGGVVTDRITTSTKYVILGDGNPLSETRQNILLYNVETISKVKLMDFLEE